jgi:HSP20 family protein
MNTTTTTPEKKNGTTPNAAFLRRTFTPPVDVYESSTEFLIVADVPGVAAERVSVVFENDLVTLTAERTDRGDVRYERAFRVPPLVDTALASAEAKHGTVVIHLPKSAGSQRKAIPVRTG